jgi:hypothetical protein
VFGSQCTAQVRSGKSYDYWAPSAQPTTNRRWRGRRSAPLASDILAPIGESPRYYSLAWQILLWLAFGLLVLLLVVG